MSNSKLLPEITLDEIALEGLDGLTIESKYAFVKLWNIGSKITHENARRPLEASVDTPQVAVSPEGKLLLPNLAICIHSEMCAILRIARRAPHNHSI